MIVWWDCNLLRPAQEEEVPSSPPQTCNTMYCRTVEGRMAVLDEGFDFNMAF